MPKPHYASPFTYAFATVWLLLTSNCLSQDASSFKTLQEQDRQALLMRDSQAVAQVTQRIREALADRAGVPEVPDESRPIPKLSAPWSDLETSQALPIIRNYIQANKWWRQDLDPTQCNHALREVATIIEACIDAAKLDTQAEQAWLSIAKEASDFLVHAQAQAELGLYPFPAMRNGEGKPFEVAEAFMRRAERNGQLESLVRNGWMINDLGDGGLQFDNGEAGVAILHLYEATQQPELLASAIRSADWAYEQPVVLNWNYNSFTIYLLAETYRVTHNQRYINEAKSRTLLGLLPGQLKEGKYAGRWLDPHNARPAYHYIILRGLLALLEVLPDNDPDRPAILESIRLAFRARNSDFQDGIINADSAMEALLRAKRLPTAIVAELGECDIDTAFSNLEIYGIERWRADKPALGASAWCGWLLFQQQTKANK